MLYRDTLTEEQARWLAGNQSRCLADLCRFLGCEGEIRAEGVALVAPVEANASVFPVGAVDRVATGVLAALVATRGPTHRGSTVAVGQAALRDALARQSAFLNQLGGRREQSNLEYLRDAGEAFDRVARGANAAFLMNPVKVDQMRDVALAGQVMPQKSTDFYPKLLSGLTMYALA